MERYFRRDIADKKYKDILLASYVIVAAIVIFVMLFGVMAGFNRHMRQTIQNMTEVQLRNFENSIERSLENTRKQMQIAREEPAVLKYLYSWENSAVEEYKISRFIQRFCINSEIAEAVVLLRRTGEMKCFGQKYFAEEEMERIKSELDGTENDSGFFLLDKERLCIYRTERDYLGGIPQYGLIGVVNLDKLKQQVNAEENADLRYMVRDISGHSILSNGLSEEECNEIYSIASDEKKKEYTIGQELFLIHDKWAASGQYGIYILQSYGESRIFMRETRNILYFSILVATLGVLIISMWLANRIYAPIALFFSSISKEMETSVLGEQYIKNQAELTSEKILRHINVISQEMQSDKIKCYLEGIGEGAAPLELRLSKGEEQGILLMLQGEEKLLTGEFGQEICRKLEENWNGCKFRCLTSDNGKTALILIKEFCRINSLADRSLLKEKVSACIKEQEKISLGRIYCAASKLCNTETELRDAYSMLKGVFQYMQLENLEEVVFAEEYARFTALESRKEMLQQLHQQVEEICSGPDAMTENTIRKRMIDAVSFIREHYREEDISVESVAEEIQMSVSYFSKLFNDYVGMSFPEYINDLRLTYAYSMIIEHRELSIRKIAESCGFRSMSYFSSQFKKKFGTTPSSLQH